MTNVCVLYLLKYILKRSRNVHVKFSLFECYIVLTTVLVSSGHNKKAVNKLMPVFHVSVLLLIINFVITL